MGRLSVVGGTLALLLPGSASAADTPPQALTLSVRETADVWADVSGGIDPGVTAMNKAEVSATFNGEAVGLDGFRGHVQVFRTDGASLTARTGDIQTISNIEAVNVTRLFETWAEQQFGKKDAGGVSIRAGLIDLNSEFDSIDPASLFVNSSHGIAPDLSKSGRNGPSIFPVSSAAIRAEWTPSERWSFRLAAFDGVPGDPNRPAAFAAVRLYSKSGALLIGEVNWKPARDVKAALGMWHYTGTLDRIDGSGTSRSGRGAYAFAAAPIPHTSGWSGWLRAGVADGSVQSVSGYVGAGITAKGLLPDRKDDRFGIAIAHAIIGDAARRTNMLPAAETTIEATYQLKLSDSFTIQPDVQYVIHPASAPGTRNALVFGLRFVFTGNFPKDAPPDEVADPTAAPDAPDAPK